MPVLTSAPSSLDDLLTLGLVAALALVVVIAVIRKAVANKKAARAAAEPVVVVEDTPAPVAPGAAGKLKLHDVEPKTAAMLMAIVADKLCRPVNELRFISIKEIR